VAAVALAAGLGMSAAASAAGPTPLSCHLSAPAYAYVGAPLPLSFRLQNGGKAAVAVLTWNTPFEHGWFAPFAEVRLDGRPLRYQGAMRKRADPSASDYLQLAPGQTAEVEVDLGQAFDLSHPGHLSISPRIVLMDVAPHDRVPRAREAHVPQPLRCNPVDVELVPPRA
jgi:hypothetical protein